MRNGSQLAIDEINEAGGVAGRPLEQIVIDADVFSPEGVEAAVRRVIDEQVDALGFGYILTPGPDFEIVPDYGAPYLQTTALSSNVERVASDPDRYHMFFQQVPSEKWYGLGFIPFLDSLQVSGRWEPRDNSIFIVEGDSVYSQTISTFLREAVEASERWEIVDTESIVSPITDWGGVISKIRRVGPAVVFNSHWIPSELAAFTNQFADDPVDSLVYLQYGPSVPEFLELTGENANGMIWSTVSGTYKDPIGNAFREEYRQRFGQDPGFSNAGSAYDQIYILAKAWG